MNILQTLQEQAAMLRSNMSSYVAFGPNSGSYVNRRICIVKDLVFGFCVWDGERLVPMTDIPPEYYPTIEHAVVGDTLFPWHKELTEFCNAERAKFGIK